MHTGPFGCQVSFSHCRSATEPRWIWLTWTNDPVNIVRAARVANAREPLEILQSWPDDLLPLHPPPPMSYRWDYYCGWGSRATEIRHFPGSQIGGTTKCTCSEGSHPASPQTRCTLAASACTVGWLAQSTGGLSPPPHRLVFPSSVLLQGGLETGQGLRASSAVEVPGSTSPTHDSWFSHQCYLFTSVEAGRSHSPASPGAR